MPVRVQSKDRSETGIGGAQKHTLREWAGRAANMHPVMWVSGPVVEQVSTETLRGEDGDYITLYVRDGWEVAALRVTIADEAGRVLEDGWGEMVLGERVVKYRLTNRLLGPQTFQICATISDHAGNQTLRIIPHRLEAGPSPAIGAPARKL